MYKLAEGHCFWSLLLCDLLDSRKEEVTQLFEQVRRVPSSQFWILGQTLKMFRRYDISKFFFKQIGLKFWFQEKKNLFIFNSKVQFFLI